MIPIETHWNPTGFGFSNSGRDRGHHVRRVPTSLGRCWTTLRWWCRTWGWTPWRPGNTPSWWSGNVPGPPCPVCAERIGGDYFARKKKLKVGRDQACTTHPYLQFDPFVVSEHRFHFEIDAHGGHEGRRETVVGVPEQKWRFAHAAVADDQQLEHVIEVLVGALLLPFPVLAGHLCSLKARERKEKKKKTRSSQRGVTPIRLRTDARARSAFVNRRGRLTRARPTKTKNGALTSKLNDTDDDDDDYYYRTPLPPPPVLAAFRPSYADPGDLACCRVCRRARDRRRRRRRRTDCVRTRRARRYRSGNAGAHTGAE